MVKQKIKFYFLWLSLICIVVFILQNVISGFSEFFVLNQNVFEGEIWRYLSSIFLHGSLVHLLYNLFALLFFGLVLEKTIGSRKFLIVFFASGIIANVISVNYYPSSLGASGAIYGVLGCLMVLRPFMMVWAFGLIMPMFLAVSLWVIGDVLRVMGLFDPGNVGSIAHLSGIGVGILLGFWFREFGSWSRIKKIEIPDNYAKIWEDRFMR